MAGREYNTRSRSARAASQAPETASTPVKEPKTPKKAPKKTVTKEASPPAIVVEETVKDASSPESPEYPPPPTHSPLPFLLILPLISRLLTFSLNSLLLHHINPTLLGQSLQLDLLSSSILFFSRESLRCALLRTGKTPAQITRSINLAFLSLPLGLFFTLVLGKAYIFGSDTSDLIKTRATWIYLISALVELTIEPSFARAQIQGRYGLRALGEGSAAVGRALAVSFGVAMIERSGSEATLLQFAYGQLTYAIMLVLIHLTFGRSYQLPLPRPAPTTPGPLYTRYLDPSQLYLAITLSLQSTLKHLLTRGDTLLLSLLSSPRSQGLYGLASNYGSLLARLLFQPLEESARSEFSKSIASHTPSHARRLLRLLLKAYFLLALFLCSLAPPLVPLFLKTLAGPAFATQEAEGVLAAYIYYIPLLALNGVTEAFVTSAARPGELHGQSVVMMCISGVFVALGWILVEREGARGLVWANMVNLGLRIVFSGWFILGFFSRVDREAEKKEGEKKEEEREENSLLPDGTVTAAVGVVALALRKGQLSVGSWEEGVKTVAAVVAVGGLTLWCEREFVREGLEMFGAGRIAGWIPGKVVEKGEGEEKKEL